MQREETTGAEKAIYISRERRDLNRGDHVESDEHLDVEGSPDI